MIVRIKTFVEIVDRDKNEIIFKETADIEYGSIPCTEDHGDKAAVILWTARKDVEKLFKKLRNKR